MKGHVLTIGLAVAVATVLLATCAIADGIGHASMQMGLAPFSHIGWKANETTGGNVCTVASYDECQKPLQTDEAGGFDYLHGVAANQRTGDIYVAEADSARVQELTADGAFVSMFGWDVNATEGKRATATQAEKNICTAASKDLCKEGVAGTRARQLDTPGGVAVDPLTGDVYVLGIEADDFRVDKYASDGRFLWRVGKKVNETTGADLCTAREIKRLGVRCGPGVTNSSDSYEHGAFKFSGLSGNVLAVGGPDDLLYVADEHRVQVFDSEGAWKREILLASISAEPDTGVVALALDAAGDAYVVYRVGNGELELPAEQANIIHKFDPGGEQLGEYRLGAKIPGAVDSIHGLAEDGSGRLAVTGFEVGSGSSGRFGSLYDEDTGGLSMSFIPPVDTDGIAFGNGGRLYVATAIDEEVAVYAPAPSAELAREPLPCEVEIESGSPEAVPCYASGRYAIRE